MANVLSIEGGQGVEAGIAQLERVRPRRREYLGRGKRAQAGTRLLPDKWAQQVVMAKQERTSPRASGPR